MPTLKKYPKAELQSCGQKKPTNHKKGCYLKLTDKKISHSDDLSEVVVDFDKNNEIVGIEFVDGLK